MRERDTSTILEDITKLSELSVDPFAPPFTTSLSIFIDVASHNGSIAMVMNDNLVCNFAA